MQHPVVVLCIDVVFLHIVGQLERTAKAAIGEFPALVVLFLVFRLLFFLAADRQQAFIYFYFKIGTGESRSGNIQPVFILALGNIDRRILHSAPVWISSEEVSEPEKIVIKIVFPVREQAAAFSLNQ